MHSAAAWDPGLSAVERAALTGTDVQLPVPAAAPEPTEELAVTASFDEFYVQRIQHAGATVVVAVNLRAPQGTVPRQVVLVGTPRG